MASLAGITASTPSYLVNPADTTPSRHLKVSLVLSASICPSSVLQTSNSFLKRPGIPSKEPSLCPYPVLFVPLLWPACNIFAERQWPRTACVLKIKLLRCDVESSRCSDAGQELVISLASLSERWKECGSNLHS